MDWIRRNPKAAIGLAALAGLLVVIIYWGQSSGSGSSGEPTLGDPSLGATPSEGPLSALPTPSASPTSVTDLMKSLSSPGAGFAGPFATGTSHSLTRHHVVIQAHSDGPMMAVGWWIPLADGKRKGADTSQTRTFRHADGTWGDGDLARILAYGGPYSQKTWCTITVDGKVTEHQVAKGPWAEVFCQG